MAIVDEPATPNGDGPEPVHSTDGPRLERRPERQGRIAYYAYGQLANWLRHERANAVPLPNWDMLTQEEQQAWVHVATAVRADTLDPDWAHRTGADNPVAPWNRFRDERIERLFGRSSDAQTPG